MPTDLPDPADATPAPAAPGLLSVLWRRKAYVVLGAVVGLGLGYLDYLRRERAYQSSAQLYVQKRRADPLPAANGGPGGPDARVAFIEDFLATHEALIRSREVLTLAGDYIQQKEHLERPPASGDYAGFIASGLTVSRFQTGTGTSANILNISFRGPSPRDTEVVVRAVIRGYEQSLAGGVRDVTQGDVAQVEAALKQVNRDLDDLGPAFKGVRDKVSAESTTSVADLKARVNLAEGKRSDLALRKIELDNRLKTVDKARREGKDPRTILAMVQRLADAKGDRPADVRPAEDPLVALRLQEEDLLQTLGKDHPQVVALRRRIEALKSEAANGPSAPADPLEFYVEVVKEETEAVRLQTKYVDDELEGDRAKIRKLEALQLEETLLTDRQDRLRKRRTDLEDRQKQLALTLDARLYDARPINPPGTGVRVYPVLFQVLLLAVGLGVVVGGGLGYLAEVTDKSFRTPEEVRRRLGLAVVGHVPSLAAAPAGVAPAGGIDARVVVHHRPKSVDAEAYRGVRTALYFTTGGKGHQVIQVTSPNPGDGKSTLCANLAVAIAQSGKRVLLVDCDFRKPRVHKIFGVDPAVGLASVISGDAAVRDAVRPAPGVPGLAVLACGPRPANPAELLTSQRFVEVLDEIKGDFDFVLLDTPPLLAVSDPAVVASRADGVLLTIRITRKTRPAAERAREILAAMGANVIGVVVNDLPSGKSGGLYGYGYGYGYKYSYSYGYEYAEGYADHGDDSPVLPRSVREAAPGANGHAPTPAAGGRHLA